MSRGTKGVHRRPVNAVVRRCSNLMKIKNERPLLLSIPVVVLVSVWFVFVVVCFSDADNDLPQFLALLFGSVLWDLVWLARFIVTLVRQRRASIPRQTLRHALLFWGFEPVVLLLCGVLALTGSLFHGRFLLSHSSLNAYAAEVVAAHVKPHGHGTAKHWVGLFRVAEIELQQDGVVRIITASGFLSDAGFTFSPVSFLPRTDEDTYHYITGAWYHWHRSW